MSNPLQLSIVNFNKDAYIIVEGKQRADNFYIVRSGKIRISKEVEVVEEEGGNILGPGDFFGVVSTMSSHSHIETAQALTDVSLISVHRDQYGLLIEKNSPVAMKIIEGFSRRMRYLDEALARLTNKASRENDPNHLFEVAEYYAKQNQYNLAYYAYYHYVKLFPKGAFMQKAMERMAKIQPYAKPVFLDGSDTTFTRTYPQNTMIFAESMPGKELYIIQKGSVKISKLVAGTEVLLAVLKPGDIFGEMSLIENKPRSASAIAYEDTILLAVNKDNFARMVTTQPQLIARLTQLLAERIWFIYKQLANTLLKDPVAKMYDALLIQLERARVPIRGGDSYTFDIGPKELINMVGLPMAEGNNALRVLLQNPRIRAVDNRIFTSDVEEIVKQASYHRKMQRIEQSRREQRHY
ncbi:MAG TPA: cyclic nucleotide-binding domain-containing protein [Spirochaetales bacterium]|nr:cyclic nucleotide-binding domain-containing protein [Spirochaetales bacterium]